MRLHNLARFGALLLSLLVGTAMVAGCDSGGGDGSGSAVSFRADGTLVEFTAASAVLMNGKLSLGAAQNGGQPSFGFSIPPTTGTYNISEDRIFAYYQNAPGTTTPSVTFDAVRGTVTLQALSSTTASGTFAFTADSDGDAIEITQGRFSVPVVDRPDD